MDGSPSHVDGIFDCRDNQLICLIGAPKYINLWFSFRNNPKLLDISDIWDSDIEDFVFFSLNQRIAILPLIKFKFLGCDISMINLIHEKNQGSSKQNIIDFQYHLIENGFAENAKWKPIT